VKEKNIGEAVGLWKESIKLSYVFMCFFTVALIVYAPEIITILYSEKYLPGVTVFRIYSIIMLLNVTYFYMIISSMGKTKYILYSTLASIGINIVLSILLYKVIGFAGPAVATLISFLAFRLGQLGISVRISGVKFAEIFPWRALGGITAVNLAFGIFFALVGNIINLEKSIGQIPESIIFGMIWMFVYLGIYFKYIKSKWDILNKGSVDSDKSI
jgi:O-antigen/teichoic acid export membrane protein